MNQPILADNPVALCDAFGLSNTVSLELEKKTRDNDDRGSLCALIPIACDTPPSSRSTISFNSPAVVEVWEDDEMIEFEFFPSRPETGFSISKAKDNDQDEVDILEGEQLPNFFSYTREERQLIRESAQRPFVAQINSEEEDFSDLWAYKP